MYSELAFESAEAIAERQQDLLTAQLHYALRHSPFYQKHFAGLPGTPENWAANLSQLPFTTKNDLHQHSDAFRCVSHQDIVEYCTTSGTTGTPLAIVLTEHDLDRLATNEQLSFTAAGVTSADIVQLMLTLDKQFMAGMAYAMGLRKIGAGIIRVGPGAPAQQWESIQRFSPTVLVAVPSFVVKLLDYTRTHQLDISTSSVKKIVAIGEPLRTATGEYNALAARILADWPVELFSTYAATEMQTAFTECTAHQGNHLIPELLIAEIVDDKGKSVEPGAVGELVITHLGVTGMPLFRYRTGDMVAGYTGTCSCGRQSLRISSVVGRRNQLIKYKGTTLYPPAIIEAIHMVAAVSDFLIKVSRNELGIEQLDVFIVHHGDIDATEAALRAAMQHKLRVLPEIHFVSSRQLAEMRPSDTRKPVSVIFA
ncbi:MAG: AMP-binding protein [Chitinophagales bacterium]